MDFREYLRAEGLPMEAAAVAGGVNVATISRICNGLQVPRRITVVKIARGLGVSPLRMEQMMRACAVKHQPPPGGPEAPLKATVAA